MSRNKGLAIAAIVVVAVAGGLVVYSVIPGLQKTSQPRALTATDNTTASDKITATDTITAKENTTGREPGAALNISKNSGKSEHAAIAVVGSDIYLVWQDDGVGQNEILIATSSDSGATFGKPVAIGKSQKGGFSVTPDIAVSGNNIYVVWSDHNSQKQSAVAFRHSNNGGQTFGNTSILGNYTGENIDPHLAIFKGDIYVSWVRNAEQNSAGDLILARSSDGVAFDAAIVGNNAINPVMASSAEKLYLAWRHPMSGDTTKNGTNIIVSSSDGTNFERTEQLQNMTIDSIAASARTIYVSATANDTLLFARSNDGNHFNITEIGNGSLSRVTSAGDNVYVVWDQGGRVFFAASTNGGDSLGKTTLLSSDGSWPTAAANKGVYVAWTENSDIMVTHKS